MGRQWDRRKTGAAGRLSTGTRTVGNPLSSAVNPFGSLSSGAEPLSSHGLHRRNGVLCPTISSRKSAFPLIRCPHVVRISGLDRLSTTRRSVDSLSTARPARREFHRVGSGVDTAELDHAGGRLDGPVQPVLTAVKSLPSRVDAVATHGRAAGQDCQGVHGCVQSPPTTNRRAGRESAPARGLARNLSRSSSRASGPVVTSSPCAASRMTFFTRSPRQ